MASARAIKNKIPMLADCGDHLYLYELRSTSDPSVPVAIICWRVIRQLRACFAFPIDFPKLIFLLSVAPQSVDKIGEDCVMASAMQRAD